MTQRRALGDLDFDAAFDDPDNGWFGHVPAVDPTSSRDHEDRLPDSGFDDATALPPPPPSEHTHDDAEDTDRWPVVTLSDASTPTVVDGRVEEAPADHTPEPSARSWSDDSPRSTTPSWESRLSSSGAWDFKVASSSPRGTRPKFAVAAVITAALVAAGVVLFLRSPGATDDESPAVAPSPSTAQPTPSGNAPSVVAPTTTAPSPSAPNPAPLPPGPPGPPPPTAEELSPPVVTRDYTPRRQNTPDDTSKPEIGVTRAPATRTQMSAKPPVPAPPPGRNSATPGDDRRGGFGFGF